MKCKYCNTELADGTVFCTNCGQKLSSNNSDGVSQRPNNQTQIPNDFNVNVQNNQNQIPNDFNVNMQNNQNQIPNDFNMNMQNNQTQIPSNFNMNMQNNQNQIPNNFNMNMPNSQNQMPNNQANHNKSKTNSPKRKKKGKALVIGLAAVALIGVVGVTAGIVVMNNKGKKDADVVQEDVKSNDININDYVKIVVDGLDGEGKATYEVDYKRFEKDYSKLNESKKFKEYDDYSNAGEFIFAEIVKGELSKSEDIANGDRIKLKWSYDEELMSEVFDCKLNCETITYNVKSLASSEKETETKVVDNIEDIVEDDNNIMVKKYSEIDDALILKMDEIGKETIMEELSNSVDEIIYEDERFSIAMEYQGYYFVYEDDREVIFGGPRNYLYLIYKFSYLYEENGETITISENYTHAAFDRIKKGGIFENESALSYCSVGFLDPAIPVEFKDDYVKIVMADQDIEEIEEDLAYWHDSDNAYVEKNVNGVSREDYADEMRINKYYPFEDDKNIYGSVYFAGYNTDEKNANMPQFCEKYNLDINDFEVLENCDNGEWYVIFPKYKNTTLIFSFENMNGELEEEYSLTGRPVLICCNPSDIILSTNITLKNYIEEISFAPGLSLEDGSVLEYDHINVVE